MTGKNTDGLTSNERILIERLMDAIELDIAAHFGRYEARLDALEAEVVKLRDGADRQGNAG